MKRSEFWQKIWIPVTKRLPPEDSNIEVLIWNYSWRKPMVMQADIARYSAESFLDEENGIDSKLPKTSSDRLFSHWCIISPPLTGNNYEQKRRRSRWKKVH